MATERQIADLVEVLMRQHPAPWRESRGYADNGGQFTSLVDANGEDLLDGEGGHLSEAVETFLLALSDAFQADKPAKAKRKAIK